MTFVFFALMGVVYFLTTYLQSVMGYSALGAVVRMLPVAGGLIVASRLSLPLVEKLGTKLVVASGLVTVAASMGVLATATVDSGYGLVALSLTMMGAGIALAMSPATEAIMGTLPRAKAGIGSAMNDVVREIGGTLGVAVLGTLLANSYDSGMDEAVGGLSPEAAEVASDSVGGAHEVAAEVGGQAGSRLTGLADQAFVDAMSTTATVAAGVALFGALIALAFLPSRARPAEEPLPAAVPEPAAA